MLLCGCNNSGFRILTHHMTQLWRSVLSAEPPLLVITINIRAVSASRSGSGCSCEGLVGVVLRISSATCFAFGSNFLVGANRCQVMRQSLFHVPAEFASWSQNDFHFCACRSPAWSRKAAPLISACRSQAQSHQAASGSVPADPNKCYRPVSAERSPDAQRAASMLAWLGRFLPTIKSAC